MIKSVRKRLGLLLTVMMLTFTTTGCGFNRTPDVEKAIKIAQDALDLNEQMDLKEMEYNSKGIKYDPKEIDDNKELEKMEKDLEKIYKNAVEEAKNSKTTESKLEIEYAYYALCTVISADKAIDNADSILTTDNTGASELDGRINEMLNLLKVSCYEYVGSLESCDKIKTSKISDSELKKVISGAEGLHTSAKNRLLQALDLVVEKSGKSEVEIFTEYYKSGFPEDKIKLMLESFGMEKGDVEYFIWIITGQQNKNNNDSNKPQNTDIWTNAESRFHKFFSSAKDTLVGMFSNVQSIVKDAGESFEQYGWEQVAIPSEEGGICNEEDNALASKHLSTTPTPSQKPSTESANPKDETKVSVQGREVD